MSKRCSLLATVHTKCYRIGGRRYVHVLLKSWVPAFLLGKSVTDIAVPKWPLWNERHCSYVLWDTSLLFPSYGSTSSNLLQLNILQITSHAQCYLCMWWCTCILKNCATVNGLCVVTYVKLYLYTYNILYRVLYSRTSLLRMSTTS